MAMSMLSPRWAVSNLLEQLRENAALGQHLHAPAVHVHRRAPAGARAARRFEVSRPAREARDLQLAVQQRHHRRSGYFEGHVGMSAAGIVRVR